MGGTAVGAPALPAGTAQHARKMQALYRTRRKQAYALLVKNISCKDIKRGSIGDMEPQRSDVRAHDAAWAKISIGADIGISGITEIDLKPESSEEATHRWTVTLGILGIAATMVSGELLKRRGIFRIPEAVIGLLVGVAAGGLSEMFESQTMAEDESFDDEFFMVWLLPPIIFAAGYNMNVPAFFDNLGPTMLLAFGGTVLSAAVVGACVYLAGQLGLAYRLSLLASFFFGSLISATDPVTVIGVRDDIFAVIFGESVLNDAVAIVLARTILSFNTPDADISLLTCLQAATVFCSIFLGSMLIGSLGGAARTLSALLFKGLGLARVDDKVPLEAALCFAFPWSCYYAAEALELSGIVAILFWGTVWRLALVTMLACFVGRLHALLAAVTPQWVRYSGGVAFAIAAAAYGDHAFSQCGDEGEPRPCDPAATLLIAVFTIVFFGGAIKDVSLACDVLAKPAAEAAEEASSTSSGGLAATAAPGKGLPRTRSMRARWLHINERYIMPQLTVDGAGGGRAGGRLGDAELPSRRIAADRGCTSNCGLLAAQGHAGWATEMVPTKAREGGALCSTLPADAGAGGEGSPAPGGACARGSDGHPPKEHALAIASRLLESDDDSGRDASRGGRRSLGGSDDGLSVEHQRV
ncbi:hypothetical protein EMIHUDRAFT_464223 [Emiliania huxleyi CCMP1516]|uniref:Cation/H+ exchanger transmembrane domain-containing protein n=2 Tax=Emiliania huxleyi TaxID=2903 RepID=A0A0D3J1P3_EMIH1|nr:hypothetical protein EMIHUDRAFT_464223 [Emiliania huxleyi CCMP1516]EOD17428.1 hypothetical protein EMIHUDRAFT_464223 [Emiliania huxleyi CCMP1516]|eukprot:XP_005769857.1 hypothetical protein EMIHUDRAFT_464223 [Emiliania huxleyi CCMP1516]